MGYGGSPDEEGETTLDAMIMDGFVGTVTVTLVIVTSTAIVVTVAVTVI